MGLLLGDGEEVGRAGPRRAAVAKDEPVPAGMDRPPSDHRELAPLEGYVVSFICFHEKGFGVPANPFMRALLHYYKVELHHITPNAVSQATIFVAVCGDGSTVEPVAPSLQGGVLRQEG
jgi:hypothetical protein